MKNGKQPQKLAYFTFIDFAIKSLMFKFYVYVCVCVACKTINEISMNILQWY